MNYIYYTNKISLYKDIWEGSKGTGAGIILIMPGEPSGVPLAVVKDYSIYAAKAALHGEAPVLYA